MQNKIRNEATEFKYTIQTRKEDFEVTITIIIAWVENKVEKMKQNV